LGVDLSERDPVVVKSSIHIQQPSEKHQSRLESIENPLKLFDAQADQLFLSKKKSEQDYKNIKLKN
jgi:hypothetical protein